MDSDEGSKKDVTLSRRKFVKLGAASAVAGSAMMASLPSQVMAEASKGITGKQTLSSLPNKIDNTVYQRFHQKNTAFCQAITGTFPEGRQALGMLGSTSNELGQRTLDKAISDAGWYIDSLIADGASTSSPDTVAYARDNETAPERYDFSSPEEAAHYVKKAARFLGADLVGITPYDERWTYASFYNPQKQKSLPPDLPFTPKSVIVMAFEMDYEAMTTAPSGVSGGAVGLGYSQMAITGASMRKFLTNIGYKTFAAGNDVALSVPYGMAAGLGEAARNGILVTYEYGPRVRIGKIFTELDLACDSPVSFGVQHFCETCMLCADACPGHAISTEKLPSFAVNNECNNPGVSKWAIDAKKCLLAWGKTKSDCATCVTSCPYNKPDFWHHRLVDKVNRLMPGPVHSVMREMDKLFGYGNSFDKKAVDLFWKS
ncbi:reductive dehalogenase [Desulfoluna sp.]|uniref:reductive dehalogenase n=1 Tax=Desulfoluna sp. TaxID=2045199 RepID=UPI00261BC029|nr:reductive dehalogenase [Desulfoluna sp.]